MLLLLIVSMAGLCDNLDPRFREEMNMYTSVLRVLDHLLSDASGFCQTCVHALTYSQDSAARDLINM